VKSEAMSAIRFSPHAQNLQQILLGDLDSAGGAQFVELAIGRLVLGGDARMADPHSTDMLWTR
jgi:hypothetical protein